MTIKWKIDYGFAVFFAALMVWGIASRDWLGISISTFGFGISVGVAERGRRQAKPHTCKRGAHLPQEGCTQPYIHPCHDTPDTCYQAPAPACDFEQRTRDGMNRLAEELNKGVGKQPNSLKGDEIP